VKWPDFHESFSLACASRRRARFGTVATRLPIAVAGIYVGQPVLSSGGRDRLARLRVNSAAIVEAMSKTGKIGTLQNFPELGQHFVIAGVHILSILVRDRLG